MQQRSFPAAVAKRLGQFQTAPGDFIQNQVTVGDIWLGRPQVAEVRFERFIDVHQQRAGRDESRLIVRESQPRGRAEVEMIEQFFARGYWIKRPIWPSGKDSRTL